MNTAHKHKIIKPESIHPEENLWYLVDKYNEFPQIPAKNLCRIYNTKDDIQNILYSVADDPATSEECQTLIYELLTKYDDLRTPLIRGIHKHFRYTKSKSNNEASISNIETEFKLKTKEDIAKHEMNENIYYIVSLILITFCFIAFYLLFLFSQNG